MGIDLVPDGKKKSSLPPATGQQAVAGLEDHLSPANLQLLQQVLSRVPSGSNVILAVNSTVSNVTQGKLASFTPGEDSMDSALASATVTFLLPLLPELAKGVAKEAGAEATKVAFQVFGWLRDKFFERQDIKDTVEELAKNPTEETLMKNLSFQLGKLLEREPELEQRIREAMSAPAVIQQVSSERSQLANVSQESNTTSDQRIDAKDSVLTGVTQSAKR